uniref:hypothetical protein n=1 Tax=Scandinavium goeteborgense TaxID=1851514 RepID=UPI002157AC7E|nr:hypothetical protein [Scandinavium goeteborgense]
MSIETRTVFFVMKGEDSGSLMEDAGSLMMDVRTKPEIAKEGASLKKFMGMPPI